MPAAAAWCLALLAIMSAAMTAKSGASLACATWPSCNGALIPDLGDYYIRIHFTHRVFAAATGAMLLYLFWRSRSVPQPVRRLVTLATGLVLLQIGLGCARHPARGANLKAVLHQAVGADLRHRHPDPMALRTGLPGAELETRMGWHYAALEDRFRRISGVNGALAILDWDTAVMMPRKSAPDRGEQFAVLKRISHELLTHAETGEQLAAAETEADLDPWQQANLREMRRNTATPRAGAGPGRGRRPRHHQLRDALARGPRQGRLRHARPRADRGRPPGPRGGDRHRRRPRPVALRRAARRPPARPARRRRRCLFDGLAAELPPLLDAVLARQATAPEPLRPAGPFPAARQKELGRALMTRLGFDFEAGRLDESTHPFCGGTPADIRITTRYREDELVSALMGVLHETGHALYEAGLPVRWRGQPVGDQRGIAVHESQSLLMEMQARRSPAFVGYLAGELRSTFGDDPAFAPDNLQRIYTRSSAASSESTPMRLPIRCTSSCATAWSAS